MRAVEEIQKKNDRQMALIIAGVAAAAVVIFAGALFLFTQLFSGHVKAPQDYATVELVAKTYSKTATSAGTLQPSRVAEVKPQVEGTIDKVSVKEGDTVKKGAVLMTIANDDIVAAVAANQRAYRQAQDEQARAQAQADQAQAYLTSVQQQKDAAIAAASSQQNQGQGSTGSSGSSAAVDPAYDAAIKAAQENLDAANAILADANSAAESARKALKAAEGQRAMLTVTAGENGSILNLKAEPGMSTAQFNAGGAAMEIADLDNLEAVLEVSQADVEGIARGQEVKITSDALPGQEFSGTVSKVASAPSKETAPGVTPFYEVKVAISSDEHLSSGMAVTGEVHVQDFGNVFYVPAEAIATKDGIDYVEVVYDDKTSAQHQVEVVGQTDDGQKVIKGNKISEGIKVRADLSE